MKAPSQTIESHALINEIQLARIRLDQAESRWKHADEQARVARRRRKEAKAAARRAKKQARQAKQDFAEAKEALLSAEERFAKAVERTARLRRLTQARRNAKVTATNRRKAPQARRLPSAPGTVRRKTSRSAAAMTRRHITPRPGQPSISRPGPLTRRPVVTRRTLSVQTEKAEAVPVPVLVNQKPFGIPRRSRQPALITEAPLRTRSAAAPPHSGLPPR